MKRRRALAAFGTALAGGLAGCSGGDGDGGGGETETPAGTGTATATATPRSTPTPTPTATATATATPASSTPTHDLDESFTVGEGSSAIGFTFRRFFRAQELGPMRTEEAVDTFLIVILTVRNPQSQSIDVPSPNMKLRASGVIKNVDDGASEAAGSDDRLDVRSIASATVPPGESVTGAIVYDAPTGHDYRIVITPAGSGSDHAVPVGDIADLESLAESY